MPACANNPRCKSAIGPFRDLDVVRGLDLSEPAAGESPAMTRPVWRDGWPLRCRGLGVQ